MTNAFAEDFKKAQELRKAIKVADTEETKKATQKAYREFQEDLEEKEPAYTRFFRDYEDAQERGNACIDFSECIWEKEIPQMVADLKRFGITEFTLSSTYSSIVKTAWIFQQNGCSFEGMEEIKGHCRDFETGDYEKVPAFKFKVN